MDDEPLVAGRVYWALHGHRWVKARVLAVVHKLNINTLAEEAATQLDPNAIGHVELLLQEAIPAAPFTQATRAGSLILVDTASHKTAGAVLVRGLSGCLRAPIGAMAPRQLVSPAPAASG
jgi:sulfate adenylyltransferase subunit 1